ncbi:MAG: STAS domain-containing protein [Synergistales bacterium]|nr:STAS domain-containing protein [Synergistales bacterium]
MTANIRNFSGDLITGLSMATILIPFSMAYSVNAGLPVSYGLSAAAIPPLMYLFFGTSPYISVGPVAMLSLVMFQGCYPFAQPGTAEYLSLVLMVTLMVGLVQFIAGFIRAGYLMTFLSQAVINGFTYAAALVIFSSQFRHILGIDIDPVGSMAQVLYRVVLNIRDLNLLSLSLALTSIALILILEKKYSRFPAPLVVVVLGTMLTYFLRLDTMGVKVVGDIGRSFPAISFPLWKAAMIPHLLPLTFTLVVVGLMESVPISRHLASRSRQKFDIDSELKGLGLANIAASFFRGYVVTGGLARTLFNYRSGARTKISSSVTSLLVVLTLMMFRHFFHYIPQPVLSSLIMSSAISLYMTEDIRYLYRVGKSDGTVLLLTFVTTIFVGVQWGLVIGILLSLILLLHKQIKPCAEELGYSIREDQFMELAKCGEDGTFPHGVVLRAKGPLHFANIHYLEDLIHEKIVEKPSLAWILLDLDGVGDMDGVAVMKMEELMDRCLSNNITLHMSGFQPEVRRRLNMLGWPEKYGPSLHGDLQSALDSIDTPKKCDPLIRRFM